MPCGPRFWTPEAYLRWRWQQGWLALLVILSGIALSIVVAALIVPRRDHASLSLRTGGLTMSANYGDAECHEGRVMAPRLTAALDAATAAWREALGIQIPTPGLYVIQGACRYGEFFEKNGGIASTDRAKYRIYIGNENPNLEASDPQHIFMHEIGHLLGVPHIEADPLMKPVYQGDKLRAPTPFAVALALAARRLPPKK